ncbi:GvpL/GvpF family gas vesicle protein [Actinomadura macrotermitis]|uniref:GvpL/GvpF family gas vesicle protein n=1 Tax=Actinomadura macrotermitis TaxID=2585200 RepID=A0A7K0C5M3_9ACTN|nr:GvpL/GvpF family gas vesicle protein [Actinomadura macrotermitis]MQY08749.1 hypothetical protein [Actinomadura macrotermitis]
MTAQTGAQAGDEQVPQDGQAPQYVYGVTRADASLPDGATGLDGKPVSLIVHGPCAAVVSDLPQGRPLGERADLIAHQGVLTALIGEGTTVLPFRFGAALTGRQAVQDELLATGGERFGEILDALQGRVELRLKGSYVQDTVLREVMAGDPQIAELSARLRSIPEDAADAAYYDRVRLGEMISQALQQRRDAEGQQLLERLAPGAEAVVARVPAREEDVVDASFLVRADAREQFEKSVAELGEAVADRIKLRLVGPLPPYDFIPDN